MTRRDQRPRQAAGMQARCQARTRGKVTQAAMQQTAGTGSGTVGKVILFDHRYLETCSGEMLRGAMGSDVIDHYVRAAEWEQEDFASKVTDYEVNRGFERA